MHRLLATIQAFNTVKSIGTSCRPVPRRWRNSSTAFPSHNDSQITDIAVLGGGITGLATAFYAIDSLPNAKVTIFEASSRLGGWLHSSKVDVGTGNVVFEQGPRTLRPTVPNGLITLDLVSSLSLRKDSRLFFVQFGHRCMILDSKIDFS